MKYRTFLPAILSLLFVCACRDRQNSVQQIAIPDSSTKTSLSKPNGPSNQGIILETENIRVFGDTILDKDRIHYTATKFEPYISFDDFKVASDSKTKKAPLDFSSNPDARRFRTIIRESYAEDTANFGGHYTFAGWRFGSNYYMSVVIDRRTGKIYNAPEASSWYDIRANSRMLVANPPGEDGFYENCDYCKPAIYIFDEVKKEFIEKVPAKDYQ